MPKLPRITGREAIRAFKKSGFKEDRTTGSHCVLKKDGYPLNLTIPVHSGKTIGAGLLKSLIEAADLTVEQFIEFLNS
jgi:predicted RNA binding protein YcfA (HicA-like mRNA interferase family)